MDRKGSPTIDDLVAATGASVRDVVLAMAGDGRLEQTLLARISGTAHDIGYAALAAVQERLGRPLRLALVFKTFRGEDVQANRFYAPVSSAITIACVNGGSRIEHAVMAVDSHYQLLDVPRALENGSCDGAFILGVDLAADAVSRLRATGCPIVLVDGYSEGGVFDSVKTDNASGVETVIKRLIAAGHQDIAILGTEPVCYPSVQERRRAYSETVRAHNLAQHLIDVSYVLTDAAAVLGVDYVQKHPAVTAVFGANDLVAVAFMQLAREAGFRLPSDLSVVGFDDVDLAGMVVPALTTMGVDKTQMGRAAVALMAYRLENPDGEPVESLLCPQLVERESIAAPRPR
jgi:DNA-binding LacI/PurR family transcriptional regulator